MNGKKTKTTTAEKAPVAVKKPAAAKAARPVKAAAPAKVKTTFSLAAPAARSVKLAGCFTRWEEAACEMKRLKDGTWKTTVTLAPNTYQYRFLVDGNWVDDPECATRRPNPFGGENCILVVS